MVWRNIQNDDKFYASIMDLVTNEIPELNAGTSDIDCVVQGGQWGQDRISTMDLVCWVRLRYLYRTNTWQAPVRRDGSFKFSEEIVGIVPPLSVGWNI